MAEERFVAVFLLISSLFFSFLPLPHEPYNKPITNFALHEYKKMQWATSSRAIFRQGTFCDATGGGWWTKTRWKKKKKKNRHGTRTDIASWLSFQFLRCSYSQRCHHIHNLVCSWSISRSAEGILFSDSYFRRRWAKRVWEKSNSCLDWNMFTVGVPLWISYYPCDHCLGVPSCLESKYENIRVLLMSWRISSTFEEDLVSLFFSFPSTLTRFLLNTAQMYANTQCCIYRKKWFTLWKHEHIVPLLLPIPVLSPPLPPASCVSLSFIFQSLGIPALSHNLLSFYHSSSPTTSEGRCLRLPYLKYVSLLTHSFKCADS